MAEYDKWDENHNWPRIPGVIFQGSGYSQPTSHHVKVYWNSDQRGVITRSPCVGPREDVWEIEIDHKPVFGRGGRTTFPLETAKKRAKRALIELLKKEALQAA